MRSQVKNKKASSQRALAKLTNTHKDIDIAANRYRRARQALLWLGVSPTDPSFRPLLAADKTAFHVGSSKETLGSSRNKLSWIWDSLTFATGNNDSRSRECGPERGGNM